MKKYFKIIAVLIMTVIAMNNFCIVCIAAFSDVDANTQEGMAIERMQSYGYVQGYGDGTFRPEATLTRAEFITIINKMYKYYVPANNIFTDIKPTDWYYGDVLAAAQVGYIRGMGDGTFRPNEKVTREQACVMLNSILKIESNLYDVSIADSVSDWAKESVEKAVSNGLFELEEGNKFRATEPITRGETCVALQKCIVDQTEIDVGLTNRNELERILKKVIGKMESNVIPVCSDEDNTKKVAEMITESLKKYLANPEHDYIADTKEVYEVYRHLGKKAEEFKVLIFSVMDTEDLMILYNYFYEHAIIGTREENPVISGVSELVPFSF